MHAVIALAAVVLFLGAQLAGLIVLVVCVRKSKRRKNGGVSLPPK